MFAVRDACLKLSLLLFCQHFHAKSVCLVYVFMASYVSYHFILVRTLLLG